MGADGEALSRRVERIVVADHAFAHLGDNYKYGDTFQIGSVGQANYFSFSTSAGSAESPAAGSVAFVKSAESTLVLGRAFIQTIARCSNSRTTLRSSCDSIQVIWRKAESELHAVLLEIAPREQTSSIDRFLSFQESHLDSLHGKLHAATYKIEKSIATTSPHPGKTELSSFSHAFLDRMLDSLARDLAKCPVVEAKPNDDSGQASVLIQQIRGLINQSQAGHAKPIILESSHFEHLQVIGPRTVPAWIAVQRDSDERVVLNETAYPQQAVGGPPEHLKRAEIFSIVSHVARLLSIADPYSVGMLRCTGVIRMEPTRYRYVLLLPSNCKSVTSLRASLQTQEPSLSTKLAYARTLGKAVMFLHAAKMVHKSIRPDNILISRRAGIDSESDKVFLIGFEQFRKQLGPTALVADAEWYKNIYRHPVRQGLRVQDFYIMQHDIYSLGVCLLEIGLWKSFVLPDVEDTNTLRPNPMLEIDDHLAIKNKLQAANNIKERLVEIARERLPRKTGNIFTEVVLACLTCLDQGTDNTFDAEDGIDDEDGLAVGVAFIQRIFLKLEDIVV